MPEWSKGEDLRSSVFVRVGSNPTADILSKFLNSDRNYFLRNLFSSKSCSLDLLVWLKSFIHFSKVFGV